MFQCVDVTHEIGGRVLFSHVTLNIDRRDRFGLVGANGTGKTTLLRIMLNEIQPSSGETIQTKGLRIGYLPQEEIVLQGKTLLSEVLRDFNAHLERLDDLRNKLSAQSDSRELMNRYEQAEEEFHRFGGYEYETEAYRVVNGLGFSKQDLEKPVENFSSGWQMRIVLARMLLNKPDLMLLDEPTNHLDIESIAWLEEYLDSFKGALVIVSHDRYFLDKVLDASQGTRGIIELDAGLCRRYKTNYTGYLHESAQRKERLLHMATVQEKRINEIKDFIARNKANKKKARLVRSREKYLERLERIQVEKERKGIHVRFPIEEVHSRRLVELKNVGHQYQNKEVLHNISITINRGDRIALIGKNGAGKSTLCRILSGNEAPVQGQRTASERLRVAAFSHALLLQLDSDMAVLDTIMKDTHITMMQNARALLGLFLFSGDAVFKTVSVLSGGEKTRLVVLKAMCQPSNLLILDEPTFHLDRDSVDAVKQAIHNYEGTTVLVTHNRDLIAGFANRIIEVNNGRISDFPGDYSYYLWKKNQPETQVVKTKEKKKRKETPAQRIQRLIEEKDARRKRLRETFSRAAGQNKHKRSRKLFTEYQRLAEEIEDLEAQLELMRDQ